MEESDWIRQMKTKIFLGLLAITALILAGCVDTVSGRKTAGVPFIRDRVEGRYQRSPEAVFTAARQVITDNGILNNEGINYSDTNAVRTIQGQINERTVWVRVEPVDPKVTDVVVQARTRAGGVDVDLAHQVEKEIALKLVTMR